MAVECVSLPRDNSLEELRVVIEEKKGEVKMKFTELKKLLEISENTATNRLDRIYTDVREGVERSERTVTQIEQAKIALNSTLVDNDTNSLLQTTIRNFDDQIVKARDSVCVVPKHISLRWSIEELKQSIENVCEVIASSTAKTPVSTEQPNKIELARMGKELEQRTKELVSLQEKKLQMQINYQNEISNLKSSLEELNYNCSSLKAELQKQSEYSKHTLITESANTEDRITSLTTHIRELEDKVTNKDTYISRLHSELENIRIHYSNLEKELQTLKSANTQELMNIFEEEHILPDKLLLPVQTAQNCLARSIIHKHLASPATKTEIMKRILQEISYYRSHPHPSFEVFQFQDNIHLWRIMMTGPDETPYSNANFELFIEFKEDYPAKPPNIRFITPIYHCNINSAGRIGLSILGRFYAPDVRIGEILNHVYGLLLDPEPDYPLDIVKATELRYSRPLYLQKAFDHADIHARVKTKRDIRIELLGSDQEVQVCYPKQLVCPLTLALFTDPVITPEGETYEREAILEHLRSGKNYDPFSYQELKEEELRVNKAVLYFVRTYQDEIEKEGEL